MPFSLEWCLEPRVLYRCYTGFVDYDLVQEANDRTLQQLGDQQETVHFITNFLQADGAPRNIVRLKRILTVLADNRLGWAVYISTNPTHNYLAAAVPAMIGANHHTCDTMQAAVEFLKQQDTAIDWEQLHGPCRL
jgi:hypothetical protein